MGNSVRHNEMFHFHSHFHINEQTRIFFFQELLTTVVLAMPVSPLTDVSVGLLSIVLCQLGTDKIGLILDTSTKAHLLFRNCCSVNSTQPLVATGPRHHGAEQHFSLGRPPVPS